MLYQEQIPDHILLLRRLLCGPDGEGKQVPETQSGSAPLGTTFQIEVRDSDAASKEQNWSLPLDAEICTPWIQLTGAKETCVFLPLKNSLSP